MIKNILSIFVAIMFMAGSLPAIVYVYSLDTEYTSGADPVGPTPWATATFSQKDAGTVLLELSNINLSGSEYIGAWYFNFNDSLDVNSLSFSRVGGTASAGADAEISTGLNDFNAAGGGYFDIIFDFPQKQADRFGAGDTIVYEITGINSLSTDMFNFLSVPSGGNGTWYTAAHVQSINGEDSGWVGPGVAVPEPSTYLMLSSLLGFSLFLVARSRKRKINP